MGFSQVKALLARLQPRRMQRQPKAGQAESEAVVGLVDLQEKLTRASFSLVGLQSQASPTLGQEET